MLLERNQMGNNKQDGSMIFARYASSGESGSGNCTLTKMFIGVEEAQLFGEQVAEAVQNGEDGIVLTIMSGESAKSKSGMYAGIEARPLEATQKSNQNYNKSSSSSKGGYKKPQQSQETEENEGGDEQREEAQEERGAQRRSQPAGRPAPTGRAAAPAKKSAQPAAKPAPAAKTSGFKFKKRVK
jgi:hypothetical protein